MHILILTVGSTGDVRPYVALGRGLSRLGYRVTLCTHSEFENLARENQLGFCPLHGSPQELLDSEKGRSWLASSNPVRFIGGLHEVAEEWAERCGEDAWEAAQGADAIIASRLGMTAAVHIAEKLRLPLLPAYLQPQGATRAMPDIYVFSSSRGAALNFASHWMAERFLWNAFARHSNRFRKRVLGLPATSTARILAHLRRLGSPTLLGISPLVVPRPKDWGNGHHLTGYWMLPLSDSWTPPQELAEFLAGGEPPVCIGFGSMVDRERGRLANVVVRVLRALGKRGILLTGWGGLAAQRSDDILCLESAPHSWLFTRVSAVVHHAGTGTTAASLAAGVPIVPVPFFADQPYWANRLHAMGVATRPVPRSDVNERRLQRAITEVLANSALRERACAIRGRLQQEDGVGTASRIIDTFLTGKGGAGTDNRLHSTESL